MPERGMYITIIAACWQHGSLPTDPWKLSKLLHTRYEVTTRWLHKWSKLVVCMEHGSSEHVVAVESPCSRCVVPKLSEFSMTLAKNGVGEAIDEKRVNKKRRDDTKSSDSEVRSEIKSPFSFDNVDDDEDESSNFSFNSEDE